MQRGLSQTVSVVLVIAVAIVAIVGLYFFASSLFGPRGGADKPIDVTVTPIDPTHGRYLVENNGPDSITLRYLNSTEPGVKCEFGQEVTLAPGEKAECVMASKRGENSVFGQDADGKPILPFPIILSQTDVPDIAFATTPGINQGTWELKELEDFNKGFFQNTTASSRGVSLYASLNIPPILSENAFLKNLEIASVTGGDFNGDGKADWAVGVPSQEQGKVYVFQGPFSGSVSLSQARAVLTGEANADSFGAALASLDLNGDGKSELVVGAPSQDSDARDGGRVYVFKNPLSGSKSASQSDATVKGLLCNFVGSSLASAGDVNGDGNEDLLVGSRAVSLPPAYCAGSPAPRAFLFHGDLTGSLSTSTAHASFGLLLSGKDFNHSLAGGGDVDSDGLPDLVVGVPAYDDEKGKAYVFSGTVQGEKSLNDALATFTGENDGDLAGKSLALSDLDGYGNADLVVGAPGNDDGGTSAGKVYVFSGPLEGSLGASEATAVVQGGFDGGELGFTLSGNTDFDLDGFQDFAVSAPKTTLFGDFQKGETLLFYGPLEGTYDLGDTDYQCSGGDQLVGDANSDGVINLRDLLTLSNVIGLGDEPVCFDLGQLLTMEELVLGSGGTGTGGQDKCCGDVTGDGSVDIFDWITLKNFVYGSSQGFPRGFTCNVRENCFDGKDNDVDGSVDFEDNDCPSSAPALALPSYVSFLGSSGGMAGRSLAVMGDQNGDSFPDLVGGQPGAEKGFLLNGRARSPFLTNGNFVSANLSLPEEAAFSNPEWEWNQRQSLELFLRQDDSWVSVSQGENTGVTEDNTALKAVFSTENSSTTPVLKSFQVDYRTPTSCKLVYFVNKEEGIRWVELKKNGETLLRKDIQPECYTFYVNSVSIETGDSYEVEFEDCEGRTHSEKLF
jgi:hypothetical protein